MSLWSRFYNALYPRRMEREIEEELQAHLEEAIESGRDPEEARRALGSTLRLREGSRDVRLLPWLDSLRSDVVFGWRQLRKNQVASAAAILSLGLATGACVAAFRLIDALLLRPLPIYQPERLYAMFTLGEDAGGNYRLGESNEYPQFEKMRAAVKGEAELIATSWGEEAELTFGGDDAIEKVYRQYATSWMWSDFGLQPAAGRLLTEGDDDHPRAHAYAVLSYDYWTRRFGRDPKTVGRTFRMDNDLYTIVGVAPKGFTGTEPGTMTEVFLPAMMAPGVVHDDWGWIRTFVRMRPGASVKIAEAKLGGVFRAVQSQRALSFANWPKERLEKFLNQKVLVLPASGGLSFMRQEYQRPLTILGVLVGLVLLIACVNVANLLTAQSAARAREMALRVSIGAGRGRLAQLMLAESAMLALFACVVGAPVALWGAPWVVSRINPPHEPARLTLPVDWRLAGFCFGLTVVVTLLFGLLPALRASATRPAAALKGGEAPHARGRLMRALIAVQVAFCCVVLVIAGLLVASARRLDGQSPGFVSEHLLAVRILSKPAQPIVFWEQLTSSMRELPGVEQAAFAGWALLSGIGSNGFVSVDGGPAGNRLAYFLDVAPGWLETMRIPLLDGRDLRPEERGPGAAVVNQAFAREYFGGANPVGRTFNRGKEAMRVVGLVPDARYRNMREPITPTAYVPLGYGDRPRTGGTLMVRVAGGDPLTAAPLIRSEAGRGRAGVRVTSIRTQTEINRSSTIRERLMGELALFFAGVALLLAAIGIYGVLDYSVLQRRREIAIRMSIGAPSSRVAQLVLSRIALMMMAGAMTGGGIGWLGARYIETLLYGVKPADPGVFLGAGGMLLAMALLTAAAPVAKAIRTDPAQVLKTD